MSNLLDLKNVSAGYNGLKALFDVSISVRAGEAVAVIGPNGAGKTTLLRVISRIVTATEGVLAMEGREYASLPAHEVLSLGIAHVPEGRRLFPKLTVLENLRLGAIIPSARTEYEQRLAFVYTLFPRLNDRAGQLAGTMSGGEQQMCAIGRALMSRPKLLLLDEPSAGLAPVIVQSMFDMIRQIRDAGFTVLIVEQNIQQVLKLVDRAYLLDAGQIRRSGPAAELLDSNDIRQAYLGIS
jgi:branched-chain amino acid transport system ATP-binding protein